MLDTHLSFKITPIRDDRIFVTLDAQTNLSGQEFSTGVEMTKADWKALQESAEDLAEMALECTRPISENNSYMAKAYLASALMNPRYKDDGRTFDTSLFLSGARLHDIACSVGMYHMDDTCWSIANKMQAAMRDTKVWSENVAAETAPDNAMKR